MKVQLVWLLALALVVTSGGIAGCPPPETDDDDDDVDAPSFGSSGDADDEDEDEIPLSIRLARRELAYVSFKSLRDIPRW